MKKHLLSVVTFLVVSITLNAQIYADSVISSSGVIDPNKTVNNNDSDYATISTLLGVLNQSKLKLSFPNGLGGMRCIVRIQPESGLLSAAALQALTVSVYSKSGNKVAERSGFTLADVTLLAGTQNVYLLKVPTRESTSSISSVEVTLTGLLTVSYRLRIYNSYLAYACGGSGANSVISSANVLNPNNVVTESTDDYATMGNTILTPSSLSVQLDGSNSKKVKYLLGTGGLITAALLSDISLVIYDNSNNVLASKNNFVVADIEVLTGNRFYLSLQVPRNTEVSTALISYAGPLHLLAPLRVYRIIANNTTIQEKPFITPRDNVSFCGKDSVRLTANPVYDGQDVSWQWYRNNSVVAGATSNVYYATLRGEYFVKVTSSENCSNLSDEVEVVKTVCPPTLSSEDNSLQVYPNPFSGSAKLQLNSMQSGVVTVSDKSGRVIETFKANTNQSAILLKSANAGIYFIKLTTDDGKVFTAKAIKER